VQKVICLLKEEKKLLSKHKPKQSMATKRAIAGLLFSCPFIVGFLLFYISPLIRSIVFSFSRITGGMDISFIGLDNFNFSLFVDPIFRDTVIDSLKNLGTIGPSILLFSFFISVMLNQKFKGRIVARVIFFLPVIITSGIIAVMQNDSFLNSANVALSSVGGDGSANTINLANTIISSLPFDVNSFFVSFLTGTVSNIYQITISSGVQILIFLAGLQSISPSLYEASSIEGATSWENFWKITLPMISPLIIVNAVYTIVDYCNGLTNTVTKSIYNATFKLGDIGLAASMSWIYSVLILLLLGIIVFAVNKMVYYEDR